MTAGDSWVPDLHWVTNDLAVGGCFPPDRATDLAEHHGIRAIVDLRGESCDDVAGLTAAGIAFLHLPTPDMEPADVPMLERGVAFARIHMDRREKVLIHCQHGIGRSALLALCVMVDQGFEPLEAIQAAKDKREAISPSPSQFKGWTRWLESNGHVAPDAHSFGCIAYRHLTLP